MTTLPYKAVNSFVAKLLVTDIFLVPCFESLLLRAKLSYWMKSDYTSSTDQSCITSYRLFQNTSHSSNISSLPTEIWFQIAELIPFSEFQEWELYRVSRAFLVFYRGKRPIYLCYRYNGEPNDSLRKQIELLEASTMHLGDEKHLKFEFQEFGYPQGYRPPVQSLNRSRHGSHFALIRKIIMGSGPNTDLPKLQRIAAVLSSLTGLTSIECLLCTTTFPTILPFKDIIPIAVSAAWIASKDTLTSLSLTFNGNGFLPDFGLVGITFPNLHNFRISLCLGNLVVPGEKVFHNNAEASLLSLAEFFEQHKTTIRRLSLRFLRSCNSVFSHILERISFTSLADFSLYLMGCDWVLWQSLARFFSSHSETLRRLKCSLDMRSVIREKSIEVLKSTLNTFGHLQTLNIRIDCDCNDFLMFFLSRVALTVRTLGIEMQLLESDVVKLANILAGEGSDCQLQNLGLEVAVFDSGLLPLLARSFPFLQSLYLIYRRRGATSRDHNEIAETRHMDWPGLQRLFIQRDTLGTDRDHQPPGEQLRQDLVTGFPSVKSFNDTPHKDDFILAGSRVWTTWDEFCCTSDM